VRAVRLSSNLHIFRLNWPTNYSGKTTMISS